MTTTSASALPIAAIPVERFVERLYAPLAWEATVRLGDPAIASRLVERVLHRAWDERERFATFDALHRHVQDAALAAIGAEADRRQDVTRFDDAPSDAPVPGSLESMSVEAVRRRIGERRAASATPSEIVAVTQAHPTPTLMPAMMPAPMPTPRPAPLPTPPPAAVAPRPVQKPRISMSTSRVDAPPAARSSARRTGGFARIQAAERTTARLSDTQKRFGLAAAAVLVLVALASLITGGTRDPQARAFSALADSTGPSYEAARSAIEQVTLPDSSVARLGSGGTLSTNAAFGDGARALRVAGPVMVALKHDSSALAAIQVGELRFLTAGGVAAFDTDAAGLVNVQVDSGDLVLVRESSRVRLMAGSTVRIGSGAPLSLTREQREEAFGWRTGRLQLSGASLTTIAAAARRWYDVDVRFPAERAQADTASIDVPLASRDSLVDALETALRVRAEIEGSRIVLRAAAPTSTAERRAPAVAPRPVNLAPPPIVALPIPPAR